MIAAGHELPTGSSDILVLDTAQHHSTMSMEDLDDEELAAVIGSSQASSIMGADVGADGLKVRDAGEHGTAGGWEDGR